MEEASIYQAYLQGALHDAGRRGVRREHGGTEGGAAEELRDEDRRGWNRLADRWQLAAAPKDVN